MRRRKGLLDVIADRLPLPAWWVWAALAVASYLLLHWIAGQPTPPARPGQAPATIVGGFLRGIAMAGQYVFPPMLALVAVVTLSLRISANRDARRRAAESASTREPQSGSTPPGDPYEIWKDADTPTASPVDDSCWNMGLLKALEWKRFEILCSTYFEAIGLRPRRGYGGPDGGVDIRLNAEGATKPGVLVQCKAWRDRMVGVALVRELFGVMAADGVGEGIVITTSTFSAEAVAFAKGKNIHLIDGDDFLAKLLALEPARQATMRKLVTEGDYTTPTCPSCGDGVKMRLRTSRKDSSLFWGCSRFPECRTTMQVGRNGG
jgi:restriction system protein